MRILFPAALAAVIAFTTLVAPASAKKVADEWPATLDCYGKPIAVTSGSNMFSPLVEVRTGKRYKPVAWHVVTSDGRVIDESRGGTLPKRAIACGYADAQASGTVIVKPLS